MDYQENDVDELQKDLKTEFLNLEYLFTNYLDTPNKALNYFYTSPFFESGSLNDLMLKGQHVDPKQDGEIYEVVEDNLRWISPKAPQNASQRHVYFNENAIFVIHKILRKNTIHSTNLIPIKVFYILNGRIYRVTSLADICRYRMYNAVKNLERCLDVMEDMSTWSLIEGYGWKAKLMENQQKYVDFIKQHFLNNLSNKNEKTRFNGNNKRKRKDEVHINVNNDDENSSCSSDAQSDLSDEFDIYHESKDLNFMRPSCELAVRMCQTELKQSWTEKNLIDKQLENLDEEKKKFENFFAEKNAPLTL